MRRSARQPRVKGVILRLVVPIAALVALLALVASSNLWLLRAETSTASETVPPESATIAILVQRTTVSTAKFPQRVQTLLLRAWARPEHAQGFGVKVLFLVRLADMHKRDALQSLPRDSFLVMGDDVDAFKFGELMWGVNQTLERFPGVKWILKVDDITFVLLHNLRRLVDGLDHAAHNQAVLGNLLTIPNAGTSFLSGGAGILMPRRAAEVASLRCAPSREYHQRKDEDVALASCLAANRFPLEDSHLFEAFGPIRLLEGDVDAWYTSYKQPHAGGGDRPCCTSPHVVSFHYIESDMAEYLHRHLAVESAERTPSELWAEFPKHTGGYEHQITSPSLAEAFAEWTHKIQRARQAP